MNSHVYTATIDLIQVLIPLLFVWGIVCIFLLRKWKVKNQWIYALFAVSFLILLNGYILKFIAFKFPNFIPALSFFYGPILYFFTNSRLDQKIKNWKIPLVHALAGILLSMLTAFGWINTDIPLLAGIFNIHFGLYFLGSWFVLITQKRKIFGKEGHSSSNYFWKVNILVLSGFVFFAALIDCYFFHNPLRLSILTVFIAGIYLLIRYPIFLFLKFYRFYRHQKREEAHKYKDSILTKEKSKQLAIQLEEVMKIQKPYLDENLDLQSLSYILKTHPKKLSQAINENFKRNFFEFINSYRIEEAKKMLSDTTYKEHKIYEIMYEVGFNSRSSFNSAFKKATGRTARQYRAQVFGK